MEEIQSGQVGIAMQCYGGNYQAQTDSMPFRQNYEPRYMTSGRWIDIQTGKIGPLYLPSGTDFRKIEFTITKNLR